MSRSSVDEKRAAYLGVLGRHMRALRKERKLQGPDMQRKAGVSTATVSKMEKGFRGPSLETLGRFCDALEVDLFDVLAEVGAAYRRSCAPEARVTACPYLRRFDGLALFAGAADDHLPDGPIGLATEATVV